MLKEVFYITVFPSLLDFNNVLSTHFMRTASIYISSQVLAFVDILRLILVDDLIFTDDCIRIWCSSVSKHAAAVHNIQNNSSPEDKYEH